MAMRKGIIRATESKEEKRRREARENGIVLEREAKKAVNRKKSERAVDLPAVGKMRGAELRISKREIREIENEGRKRQSGRRRRRR